MYDFKKIEDNWTKYWESHEGFKTDTSDFSKPKYYALGEFPYPSSCLSMPTVSVCLSYY